MQVNDTLTTPTSATPRTATKGPNLDYDSFLKLLIAEMKNQDPLNPTNSSEYVAQFAAFSNVEQAIQTNKKLDGLLASNALTQAGALIGRQARSGDGTVAGEIASIRITDQGPVAVLTDARTLPLGAGVTIG